ncbi:uncharacterized protein VICG_01286 [Vittaforma corneae ATCC 50505]|uniref:Ubiquitin-like domain-containing protein n=1 Tax=Vittaforma corneae (strain ATCC 50505) TaxID=993615 RepID=L2GLA4_VITCO|nr:uncharacterized protein VICG_01286 [Vittaforma corneae ATCC 50505]ELA41653.1 hypothetical protein VICG_01286 [Vittaforma corneae ATCC 50505]
MTQIQVQTRGNSEIQLIDDEKILTIMDLKRKLNEHDPSSVLLTFKGKILTDSTPLSALGRNIVFTMEKDIEFAQIESKTNEKSLYDRKLGEKKLYKSVVNDQIVFLKEDEIFFKEGKPFFITKKTKKLKLKDVVDFLKKNLTKAQIVQLLFIMFVVFSKNYPLLAIILTINLLRVFSFALLKSKAWNEYKGHLSYSAFMFFASLLAIDHEKFIRKTVKLQQ